MAAATASAPAEVPGCKGNRIALVIGNKAYPDSEVPLEGVARGAQRVAEALRSIGFDVQLGENLTRAGTETALRAFEGKIKPGSAVFLYFSGYGVQVAGRTYLLPVDASIWNEADVASNGLGIDRVLAEIADRKAAVEVLVVDAARRNPYERRFRAAGSAGLAPPSAASGNLVALFSAAPEKTFDPRDTGADSFAEDVAREITAPHATAQEAFRQVRAVMARTSRAGQTPWGFTTLSNDLPLDARDCRPAGQAAAQPAPAPAQPDPPEPPPIAPPAPPQVRPPPPRPAAPQQAAVAEPPAQPAMDREAMSNPSAAELPANKPETSTTDANLPEADGVRAQPGKTHGFETILRDDKRLDETRELLFEQGFNPGPVGSPSMRAAILEFERKQALPLKEQPTDGLLDALRARPSLQPWAAIAVTGDAAFYGMSWGQPTRSQALADARAKCRPHECSQAISFSGRSCGAFAKSPRFWNASPSDTGAAARKAALTECARGGIACRLYASTCADGSDKTN